MATGRTGRTGQFDRDRLAGMCESEAAGLREYAEYLDGFKLQVADTVNSEDRLQEIYQETAPTASAAAVETGTVRAYLVGNDLRAAAVKIQQVLPGTPDPGALAPAVVSRMRESRRRRRLRRHALVPASLFDSYASECLGLLAGGGAARRGSGGGSCGAD
uniref:MCM_N domain-containing protein n=1 Tax=Macrostomum lignano TaxID=282301 RepID=A0A1I8ISF2_9PLAT